MSKMPAISRGHLGKDRMGSIPKLLSVVHFDVSEAAFFTAREPTRNTTAVRAMLSTNLWMKGRFLVLRGAICSVRRSVPKIEAEMITVRCFIATSIIFCV